MAVEFMSHKQEVMGSNPDGSFPFLSILGGIQAPHGGASPLILLKIHASLAAAKTA